jgi:hypothetical protein
MLDEESSLDDDVIGMLDRVSKQHASFRAQLKESPAETINTLAMVEIAHQLAYANTLKGIELLISLEDDQDASEVEEE